MKANVVEDYEPGAKGHDWILLVDLDAQFLKKVARLLERDGYLMDARQMHHVSGRVKRLPKVMREVMRKARSEGSADG